MGRAIRLHPKLPPHPGRQHGPRPALRPSLQPLPPYLGRQRAGTQLPHHDGGVYSTADEGRGRRGDPVGVCERVCGAVEAGDEEWLLWGVYGALCESDGGGGGRGHVDDGGNGGGGGLREVGGTRIGRG